VKVASNTRWNVPSASGSHESPPSSLMRSKPPTPVAYARPVPRPPSSHHAECRGKIAPLASVPGTYWLSGCGEFAKRDSSTQ
jgi:hypothetical protein